MSAPTPAQDGGPAFPTPEDGFGGMTYGMSLRDWFAGQALGQLLETRRGDNRGVGFADHVAGKAYELADAMLRARALAKGPSHV